MSVDVCFLIGNDIDLLHKLKAKIGGRWIEKKMVK